MEYKYERRVSKRVSAGNIAAAGHAKSAACPAALIRNKRCSELLIINEIKIMEAKANVRYQAGSLNEVSRLRKSGEKTVKYGESGKDEVPCEMCDCVGKNMLGGEEKIKFTVRGDDFKRVISNAIKMYKGVIQGAIYVHFVFLGDGKMNILAGCSTWVMRYTCESNIDRQCLIRVEGDALLRLSMIDFKGRELSMTLIGRGARDVLKIESNGETICADCTTHDVKRYKTLYLFLSIKGSNIACIKAEDLKRACKTDATHVRIYLDGEDLMIGNYNYNYGMYEPIRKVKAVKANGKADCREIDVWLYREGLVKALKAYKSSSVLRIGVAYFSREFDIQTVSLASDDRFVIYLPDCSTLKDIKEYCQSGELGEGL